MKAPLRARLPQATDPPGMVRITGGTFLMGSDRRYPESAPAHHVTVNAFWMDPHPVANAEFAYGLHDMAGNVWEWTTDWFQDHGKIVKARFRLDNPRGAAREDTFDPRDLCAPSCCHRYRPAARMVQAIDTATCDVGFRCIVRGDGLRP